MASPSDTTSPPSYESVSVSNPRDQLPTGELASFVLDGNLIFPGTPPSRAMYELSSAPCEAMSSSYALRKVVYRVTARGGGGEGTIRSRVEHVYDFRPYRIPQWLYRGRGQVLLFGRTRGSFKEVLMSPGWSSGAWTVGNMFKAEQRFVDLFRHRAEIHWVDFNGRLVAVEERLERRVDGKVEVLPTLNMKVELREAMLDLLVACWTARLWKEAAKDLKEPINWDKVKEYIIS